MPGFIKPQLATLKMKAPAGEDWIHEIKKAAARLNFEGIVSKRVDAPYPSERTEAWWKVKTVQRDKFPIVGFVKDPTGVAALYLGKQDAKDLLYTERLAPVGAEPNLWKSARRWIRSLVRRQSSPGLSGSPRRRGSSRSSTPK